MHSGDSTAECNLYALSSNQVSSGFLVTDSQPRNTILLLLVAVTVGSVGLHGLTEQTVHSYMHVQFVYMCSIIHCTCQLGIHIIQFNIQFNSLLKCTVPHIDTRTHMGPDETLYSKAHHSKSKKGRYIATAWGK